ncbi:MAG TPA: RsmE family RNA methyltransferase [Acidimicrobiia bacterium]
MTRVAWCASADAVAHLIVEQLDDQLRVTDADGHHLQRVRRLRTGELITAADGAGQWREYTIAATEPGALTLEARAAPATEPVLHPPLRVACALTKGEHPDAVVRHCSELGVDAVLLVIAARSVVRWDTDRATRALTRLRRVAREAAAQCRRARLLTVEPAVPLADLARQPGLLVADRDGDPAHLLPAPTPAGWLVVVGPEGGLTPDEHTQLGHPPRLAVGPHVLRAETSALAAAAALTGHRQPRPAPTPQSDHPA